MIKARPVKDDNGQAIAVELLNDDRVIARVEFDGSLEGVVSMIELVELAIREERMRIIDVEQRTRTKRNGRFCKR